MSQFINPNGGKVRIASTSGHVVFIGDEPVNIMKHMESEAKAKGCLPLSSYKELEEKIKKQMEERMAGSVGQTETADPAETAKNSSENPAENHTGPDQSAILEEQELKKIIEVMNLMLDTDDDKYFTGNGLPRASVVNDLAGFEVSKELREKAWDIVVKEAAAKK